MTTPAPSAAPLASARARAIPIILLLVGGAMFGFTYVLYKAAADHRIPVFAFVFWQTLIAGGFIYVLCLVRRQPMRFDGRHVRVYLILGVLGIGIPHGVMFFVAHHLPAGIMGLNVTIEPVVTYLLALLLALEKLRTLRVLCLLFAVAGVLCILLPEASLPSRAMAGWVLLAFVAPTAFAVQNVLAERYWPAESTTWHLTGGMMLGAAVFTFPFMVVLDEWWFFEGPMDPGDWALLGTVAINVFGMWMFLELIRTAGAVLAATITYIETLAAVGWGMALLSERHSGWIWAAIALLFIGLTLIHRSGRKAVTRHHAAP